MSKADPFQIYLREIQSNLFTGASTEHTHRSALKILLETIGKNVQAINEPKRIECGAPDYIIIQNKVPIGYVEAKDVGSSLDASEDSDQIKRYLSSLNNLILTDYLEFRWYVNGEKRVTERLARISRDGKITKSKKGITNIIDILRMFFAQQVPIIENPKELAQRMAALARMLRKLIEEIFEREVEKGTLHAQLEAFRETLIPDLSPTYFADMYAQTIAYGLFAAKVNAPLEQNFTREQAAWNLPKTNPFLRKLFNEIAGPDLDDRITWLADDLARLLARTNMQKIRQNFGKRTRHEDPVVHFYETFLAAYDPEMRKTRGVFYTPEPVVSYIIRSLDYILRSYFNRPLGLGDGKTLILDPAAGTGTFLYFVIQHINEALKTMGQLGAWNDYVLNHLLPRIFGFELLMAPYTVAHMKLGILLQETGYKFVGNQRLGIFLTNSLQEAITKAEILGFAGFITEEGNAAAEVKRDKPIMVVLGNPPYSVSSLNKGAYIDQLMERYKTAVRNEQNIQPLSDDYIKFIRFAHDRIEKTGYGIIGMISNNSFLSGLIHRGMREELMKTFDEIYVFNLHGNAGMREVAPDGSDDENVFDIRQGVTIFFFIKKKNGNGLAQVKYADLWGLRDNKYKNLLDNCISTTEWQKLEPISPYFFFVPKDFDLLNEYEKELSITEIFPINATGFTTHRDHFVIDFDEQALRDRIKALRDIAISNNQIRDRFNLQDSNSFELEHARKNLQSDKEWDKHFTLCLYRPFDIRPIYYSEHLLDRPRFKVMRHMFRSNLALLAMRQVVLGTPVYSHFGVSKWIVDNRNFLSNRGRPSIFPLYLYHFPEGQSDTLFTTEEGSREPNLSPEVILTIKQKLDLDFVPECKGDLHNNFGPEDIFYYIYSIFHSPTYRERYSELLKIGFPRIPITSDRDQFKALIKKGEKLALLHLFDSAQLNNFVTGFPVVGSNKVETVQYREHSESNPGNLGRVYINESQYFEGITNDIWEHQVGGYQVLEKWLKDRKGRKLSFDDLLRYQKIVVALKESIYLMLAIDELIPSWPIE